MALQVPNLFRAQVTFGAANEIPRDAMTNSFHFHGTSGDYGNIADMLYDFYDVADTASAALRTHMTDNALDGSWQVKIYDLGEDVPRIPVFEDQRSLTLGSGAALPTEVALVASFHCPFVSGQPAARRRNRIYLGGLATTTTQNGRPSPAVRASLLGAMEDLNAAARASLSWTWRIWSPTSVQAGQDLETSAWIVNAGWVDNAWDTQRRRGVDASVRETWAD